MTSRPEDDLELRRRIAELQAGVRIEINSRYIFDRYYPWVRRFFVRRGHTAQDSEDLAQETFGRVFRQLSSFRYEASFSSWLFAVAANLGRNENRRRHREKRDAPVVSIDERASDDAPPWEPAAMDASPARTAYEKERREALAKAVQELPPQMKQVLALRVDHELKYREIATVLQISIETVKAHLFQARQRLREKLGEDHGEWED